MPRWVKWFSIGTVVLIGAFILVHLLGGAPRHH
jgi:hypothetical protein